MRRFVAPGFLVLALVALACSSTELSVRPVLAGALFALGPGFVLIRLVRKEPASLAFELGLALALSPFVLGIVVTALLFAGVDIHGAAIAIAVAIAGGAGYLAWRERGAPPPAPVAGEHEPESRTGITAWVLAIALTLVCIWPAITSNRVRASVHGMLHASILYTAVEDGVPPENPFFAGRPLRYYWMFHVGTAATCSLGGVDPTVAFSIGNGAALLAFLLLLARLGADAFGSRRAAALAIAFGFLGLDPVGGFLFGNESHRPRASLADLAAGTDPILYIKALAIDQEDRLTATFTKFMNVSSFPQALALLVATWILILRYVRRPTTATFVLLAACVAGGLALSPITGASAGLAAGAAAGFVFVTRLRDRDARTRQLGIAGALACGLLLSIPLVLLSAGDFVGAESGASATEAEHAIAFGPTLEKVWRVLWNLGPLLLLALPVLSSLRRASTVDARKREGLVHLCANAALLMVLAVVLHFAVNSEYKLVRMASPLLGVLAAGALTHVLARANTPLFVVASVLLVAPFVPTNAIAWNAYRWHARAVLPFASVGGRIELDPGLQPIAAAYEWLRTQTPENAVILAHPLNVDLKRPHEYHTHFAGMLHGDEIPVLAHRPVWADNKYYMTDYEPDLPLRHQLIANLFAGRAPTPDEIELLSELRRPVYLLVRADDPDPGRALRAANIMAPHVFQQVYRDPWAAIFEFRP